MNLILFINSIYISNLPIGRIKQIFYKKLQKKYNFDRWHITPINLRPYAIDMVNNLNKYITKNSIKNEGYIIEIGCGLGDIIGHICYPSKSKLGLDLDKRVIAGAKIAHSHKAIFHCGSFHSVCGKNILFLITVNFIHNIPPDVLKKFYSVICKKNRIRFIILDNITSKEYAYNHRGEYLFQDLDYVRVKCSKTYNVSKGIRRIEIWEKKSK